MLPNRALILLSLSDDDQKTIQEMPLEELISSFKHIKDQLRTAKDIEEKPQLFEHYKFIKKIIQEKGLQRAKTHIHQRNQEGYRTFLLSGGGSLWTNL